MESVSTGVLYKNKEHYLRSKDKAKKSYDVLRHIQMHMSKYKKGFAIHYIKPTAQLLLKSRFPKSGQAHNRQVVNPRHQTPQGQSVAKPETDGATLNPIFWRKVQGQKHPGIWEIAERQISSVKMLFNTNIKVTSILVLNYLS